MKNFAKKKINRIFVSSFSFIFLFQQKRTKRDDSFFTHHHHQEYDYNDDDDDSLLKLHRTRFCERIKNVEQTRTKPRRGRVGKKRLPRRLRRLFRPEPVRAHAERKLRRGVRDIGKTVHGVPMATRARREV